MMDSLVFFPRKRLSVAIEHMLSQPGSDERTPVLLPSRALPGSIERTTLDDLTDRLSASLPPPSTFPYSASVSTTQPYSSGVHPPSSYVENMLLQRSDFTNNVPFKFVSIEPKSMMGGVLGYTWVGEAKMTFRDDIMSSSWREEVDIHESIHTPDEYETRVRTWAKLDKSHPSYAMVPFFMSRNYY